MAFALAGIVVVLLAQAPAAGRIAWQRDHGAAYGSAAEERRPILVHFRSDHCERIAPGMGGAAIGGTEASRRGGAIVAEAPRSGGASGPTIRDEMNDCDRMEELVWSNPAVIAAAARCVPVLSGDTSERTLVRRYEVASMPTTLVADPWGNEMFRAIHFVEPGRMARLLTALPADFSALEPAARALQANPRDAPALEKAAAFYEAEKLREVAELYYEKLTLTEAAKKDAVLRRRVAVARGTNLLRIGKQTDAARVFRDTFEDAPDGAQGEAVLFGWMMAELQQGRLKEAERPYQELVKRFPDSRYTARAKENMAAAAAPKKG